MKTLSIQLKDDVYEKVVNEAKRVDRSIRNMVSVLVERGLNSDALINTFNPTFGSTLGMSPELEERANKAEKLRKKKKENPKLRAVKAELEELHDQLDDTTDSSKASEILAKIQELQREASDITKEIEGEEDE